MVRVYLLAHRALRMVTFIIRFFWWKKRGALTLNLMLLLLPKVGMLRFLMIMLVQQLWMRRTRKRNINPA